MALAHVALVVETPRVGRSEASEVAAALQRQVSRDFSPHWRIEATVDAFTALEDVPPGYWPVLLRDRLPTKGVIGIHLDDRGQPYALVQHTPNWTLIASHEILEMLADPQGNRLLPGGSLKPGQGVVDYIVEVCDPCGIADYAYTVNGILVSDFILPNYYDPFAVPGVRYDFSGRLDRPRGVLRGGYVAWNDPTTGEWWRADRVDGPLRIVSLGMRPEDGRPLRERIDEVGTLSFLYRGVPDDDPNVIAARVRYESSRAASRANAVALNVRIDRLFGALETSAASTPSMDLAPIAERRRTRRVVPVRDPRVRRVGPSVS